MAIKVGDVYRTKPGENLRRLRVVSVEPRRVGLRNVESGRLSYRYTHRGEIPGMVLESPLNLAIERFESGDGMGIGDMAELVESLLRERDQACVIGRYCRQHMFIHGAEAEELREKVELLAVHAEANTEDVRSKEIRALLDDVDARDSLAFLEYERSANDGTS